MCAPVMWVPNSVPQYICSIRLSLLLVLSLVFSVSSWFRYPYDSPTTPTHTLPTHTPQHILTHLLCILTHLKSHTHTPTTHTHTPQITHSHTYYTYSHTPTHTHTPTTPTHTLPTHTPTTHTHTPQITHPHTYYTYSHTTIINSL